MIRADEMIPIEVIEAYLEAVEHGCGAYDVLSRAINAWPGMLVAAPDSWVRCRRDGPTIILPMSNGNIILPHENSNERE